MNGAIELLYSIRPRGSWNLARFRGLDLLHELGFSFTSDAIRLWRTRRFEILVQSTTFDNPLISHPLLFAADLPIPKIQRPVGAGKIACTRAPHGRLDRWEIMGIMGTENGAQDIITMVGERADGDGGAATTMVEIGIGGTAGVADGA